jgi:DNA polymerase-1
VIGGVMVAAGLGDPCLPFQGEYEEGGDLKTEAMRSLYIVCFDRFGDAWVTKKQIYQCVQEEAEEKEALRWFGDLEAGEDARKNQTRLGMLLSQFKGRILGSIRLEVDKSAANSQKWQLRFVKNTENTLDLVEKREPREPCEPIAGRSQAREEKEFVVNVCDVCDAHDTADDAAEVHKVHRVHAKGTDFLAIDLETHAEVKVSRRGKTPKIMVSGDALRPWKGEIRLVSLADDGGNIQLFDLRARPLPPEIHDALGRQLLIVHNASFDLLFLSVRLGIKPKEVFCTLTASRLLTPSHKVSHSLGAVLERHLGIILPKEHGATDWGSFVLTDDQLAYARDDVRYLHQLKGVLEAEIEKADLSRVFKLESDLIPVVVDIERRGFAVDAEKMRAMLDQAEARQSELQTELRTKFGNPTLNPDSPTQIAEAFESVGEKLTSTHEETLTALDQKLVPAVLEYRGVSKLAGSITGLLKHVLPDGRIHAQFKPLGSDPGRFSSSRPNLQNVDRGELRKCFVPSENHKLIVADYRQIELRIGAIFADDTVMLDAFRAGEDLHRKTAAGILSKQVADVVKADRQLAKAVNFGFLYGQGPEGFQRYAKTTYGITLTLEEATEFRQKFFEQYQGLKRWHQAAWNKVETVTEARTVLGRILLPRGDTDWAKFQMLTNYVTQGSAADVIKVAMVKLAYRLPPGFMVATVHDELVFDVPVDGAEGLCELIRITMIDAFTEVFGDIIPMEVEAKVCSSWAEK